MEKTVNVVPTNIAHCQPSAPATPQAIEGPNPETGNRFYLKPET